MKSSCYCLVANVAGYEVGFAIRGLPEDEWDITAHMHLARLFDYREEAEDEVESLRVTDVAKDFLWEVKEVRLG